MADNCQFNRQIYEPANGKRHNEQIKAEMIRLVWSASQIHRSEMIGRTFGQNRTKRAHSPLKTFANEFRTFLYFEKKNDFPISRIWISFLFVALTSSLLKRREFCTTIGKYLRIFPSARKRDKKQSEKREQSSQRRSSTLYEWVGKDGTSRQNAKNKQTQLERHCRELGERRRRVNEYFCQFVLNRKHRRKKVPMPINQNNNLNCSPILSSINAKYDPFPKQSVDPSQK
ncbi:hypothetical protein niasHT_011266 [Heterodera trifolii]|uniref:Uncharacterized protein n=1 Tax=Heterodera trifolii TaxID=157864 RepID=A0ABD2L6E4_9BILA